ncbi:MAG: hypothetical protein M1831_004610 [Alyxoria varia]|nr:MAG: hypothetical protein M1831_004610 [Alyxoria varia]
MRHTDWPSKLEDSGDDDVAKFVKGLFGRGGELHVPNRNVLVSATNFGRRKDESDTESRILALPAFLKGPRILPGPDTTSSERALSISDLERVKVELAKLDQQVKSSDGSGKPTSESFNDIVILICGHGGRDSRCGTMGPILQAEFENLLNKNVALVHESHEHSTSPDVVANNPNVASKARIAQITHIGGHKFAGNVIIHLPPTALTADGSQNPLASSSVWYGRVEPKHVEGIILETILRGSVIRELFRGGIDPSGGRIKLGK